LFTFCFFQMKEVAIHYFWDNFPHGKANVFFDKNGLGYIFGDSFGHPEVLYVCNEKNAHSRIQSYDRDLQCQCCKISQHNK
jgi:hypothetical protein